MIAIVDYGGGNLRSVEMALFAAGAQARLTSDPGEILAAAAVVSPGQGAFGDVMRSLERRGLLGPVRDRAAEAMRGGRPFLGICVGMQYLVESSEEEPGVRGLGLLAGRCRRFRPADPALKIPQMGWNRLIPRAGDGEPLLRGLPDEPFVYFVHSYYVELEEPGAIAAETDYAVRYCSALARGNLFATQFHPEKSQRVGLQILRNFVEITNRFQPSTSA